MGADISVESVAGKLNRIGYESFIQALRQAKSAGNRNIELGHWILHLLQKDRTDLALTADHFKLSRAKLLADTTAVVNSFRKNETEMPGISNQVADALDRGWHYATLLFGETQIRTGHLLVAMLKSIELRRALIGISQEFSKIPADEVAVGHRAIWAQSEEGNLRPMDGSGVAAASAEGTTAAPGAKGTTALDRFSQDLTAKAKAGEMDPILGRDEEIRQIVDVLMRRRQNNPILTGEAGVGKTAVVEGFAQRVASGDVPPPLRGVKVCALDVGLMQAGASMKGEFEQRLRSVIDEVQSSPTPIILFIDEAHTLIGAGGAAGTGDAANLLKPALARGTLRTIAATTWAEYRQYFEKDPALTRRFQSIFIGEPDVATAAVMLRGLVGPMEKHHKVRVTDEAIVAAVNFSNRYIPARQLPDKAVSLLDTACARVAISQNAKPAAVEDAEVAIASLETETQSLARERDLGAANEARIAEIEAKIAEQRERLAGIEADWKKERALVEEILALRGKIANDAVSTGRGADDRGAADRPGRRRGVEARGRAGAGRTRDLARQSPRTRGDRAGQAHDLRACRRAGGRLGRFGLDRHSGRQNGRRRGRDGAPPRRHSQPAHCGSEPWPENDRQADRDQSRQARQSEQADWRFHAVRPLRRRQNGDGARPRRNALWRRAEHHRDQYVGVPGGAHRLDAQRRASRLCRLWRRRAPDGGGAPAALQRHPARRDRKGPSRRARDLLPGVRQGGDGRRNRPADRLQEHAHPADLQRRDGGHHARRRKRRRLRPRRPRRAVAPGAARGFPPALLGRIVTIPYYPLSPDMLAGIVRLQLGRIGKRIEDNHRAKFHADQSAVDHIVSLCNDPDSGGRVIDNIITNTILPALSREILARALAREDIHEARVSAANGTFVYDVT